MECLPLLFILFAFNIKFYAITILYTLNTLQFYTLVLYNLLPTEKKSHDSDKSRKTSD
jgi:hypothetical protein